MLPAGLFTNYRLVRGSAVEGLSQLAASGSYLKLTDHRLPVIFKKLSPYQYVKRLDQWLSTPVNGMVREGLTKLKPRRRLELNLGPPDWQSYQLF